MTPPYVFISHETKTDTLLRYAHFIFMYPRSSSRELHDTPQDGGIK
jgi:hypothetical protein